MKYLYSKTMPILTAFILCISLNNVQAQQPRFDFENATIKTQKMRDNIYMLEGLGGNVGLSVGEDGAIIIDNQFPQLSEKSLLLFGK